MKANRSHCKNFITSKEKLRAAARILNFYKSRAVNRTGNGESLLSVC